MAKVAVTPKGKEVAYRRKTNGMFEIYFTTGGELPLELQGEFSDSTRCTNAITIYMSKKNPEVTKAEESAEFN
jgi:hypothetical protein